MKVKQGGQAVIKRRDVVMLKNNTSKCIFWKLAIVDKLLIGFDGHDRATAVKVFKPQGSIKLLRRNAKHLFPIEVRVEDSCNDSLT